MNRFLPLLAAAAVLALGACAKQREPDDAQLKALLQREQTSIRQPVVGVDPFTVLCLRALSTDASLKQGLPVRIGGEDGVKRCRERLDARLANGELNPHAFTLAEVTAPATVRRAMALVDAAVQERKAGPRVPPQPVDLPPMPDVEAVLAKADASCRQANERTTNDKSNMRLYRYAEYCTRFLEQTRRRIEDLTQKGDDESVERIARNVWRMTHSGEQLLAKSARK